MKIKSILTTLLLSPGMTSWLVMQRLFKEVF